MNLKDRLTPKDTKEIRPGFFIQKKGKGWRVVEPIAWDGEWRTKEQLRSVFNLRTLFTISLILFLAWSYFNETEFCRELQQDPCDLLPNITNYCIYNQQSSYLISNEKREDTFTLQDNP